MTTFRAHTCVETEEGAERFIFLDAYCALRLRPLVENTGKHSLVRRAAKKRRRTEVSAPPIGSPGAIGRHDFV